MYSFIILVFCWLHLFSLGQCFTPDADLTGSDTFDIQLDDPNNIDASISTNQPEKLASSDIDSNRAPTVPSPFSTAPNNNMQENQRNTGVEQNLIKTWCPDTTHSYAMCCTWQIRNPPNGPRRLRIRGEGSDYKQCLPGKIILNPMF